MEIDSTTLPREPLRGWERVVVILDVLLGVALCAVAVRFYQFSVVANADPYSPHGGAYEMLGAVLVGPLGVLFLLAALGVARRWRARWWLQALPFAYALWLASFGLR